MSEHSKGPELRYDADTGEIRRGRELMADVYLPHGPYGPALAERDALGRKMAASPELVEALLKNNAGHSCHLGGGADHPSEETTAETCPGCLRRAALKKAGVEP